MSPSLSQLISAPTAKDYQPCAVDILSTPVGVLQLNANAYGLSHLTVVGSSRTEIPLKVASDDELARAKSHIEQAKAQLLDYFRGELTQFHLSLAPKGTEFQQQVWQALVQVGYGQSCSYGEIAQRIDRPKAVRAVGAANGANPIAIIVPCHRIIGKNGQLTGYAYGLTMKQQLLMLESTSKGAHFTLE
ncbi:methylated-DNA--[protein]-cysteine S-methyltransferase [Shewanella xiamenensis]|uniref:methylated-DNA--[protein]-cysteine S-methyltransferase n=1 Tax=Shewanella xiamenensis TaxID=332186 RepID=UPI00255AEEC2|nr:methylated-DNA--[protein]-cysteine S-methyltransferase [Shewanella xiamenensis]MDL3983892.1 methylated-DNA--[protein]-cysteine S-methyltransferase [Shewanella xiamenensis]